MVYGYARAARDNNGTNSIENQTITLKKAGADVICSEICSGMQMKRPTLTEMFGIMKKGDRLLVVSRDRLTRNVGQFMQITKMLKKKDVELVFLKVK